VDVLVDSAVRDPPELLINGDTRASSTSPSPPSSAANGTFPPASIPGSPSALPAKVHRSVTSAAASKQIRIEDRTYYAVSATAEVLDLLLDYLRVIVSLSTLTIDTMGRVIEFLKAFNSRTCQVVLGAGAMRSAGLKNITAKHLGTSHATYPLR
jgi:vacuolar protein sorting-associated protein 54